MAKGMSNADASRARRGFEYARAEREERERDAVEERRNALARVRAEALSEAEATPPVLEVVDGNG